jgi:hypothetical protein
MAFMNLVFLLSLIVGLYLLTLGIWELREGSNRKKYITLTTIGLFLIFVFPRFDTMSRKWTNKIKIFLLYPTALHLLSSM